MRQQNQKMLNRALKISKNSQLSYTEPSRRKFNLSLYFTQALLEREGGGNQRDAR